MFLAARRSRRLLAAVTTTVALALGCAGCALSLVGGGSDSASGSSPSPAPSAGSDAPTPGKGLAGYYGQHLAWQPCRDHMRCADIDVPLDYAHPDKSISLALLKVPAKNPDTRVGSLLVNPGGPGVSGVDYAAQASSYFGPALLRSFDIVGFDPRGVGESTPLDCLPDGQLARFLSSDPDPDTPAERTANARALAAFGRGCVQRSGALAGHLSTVEVAKDVDIIRSALGEPRLSYFGASYGTFLGATYADLFPKRVGRMVLDGAVDPSLDAKQVDLAQAKGFETALRSYVAACVQRGGCFLGDSVDAGTRRIATFLQHTDAHPVATSEDRRLTEGDAVYGIWAPLYNKQSWPVLDAALRAAFAGNGEILLRLADSYIHHGPDGFQDNAFEVLYDVDCLDDSESIPVSQVPAEVPEFEKASPTFGSVFAYSLSACSGWPVRTGRRPHPLHAAGSAPILVVGTTRDPATPFRWAQSLADQLDAGVLVRRDGDGHTGYRAGNTCVDDTVESYLVSGDAPTSEVDCGS